MRVVVVALVCLVAAGQWAEAACGDGVLDVGEMCDDNGRIDGDGCSAACMVEDGWGCSGIPSKCDPDECARNVDNCADYAVCTNTPDSYTCQCPRGASGSGYGSNPCVDINECAIDSGGCPEGSVCYNLQFHYDCVCVYGGVHTTAGGQCPERSYCGDGKKAVGTIGPGPYEECDDGNDDPDDGCDQCKVVPVRDGCSTGTPSVFVAIAVIVLAGLRRRKRA